MSAVVGLVQVMPQLCWSDDVYSVLLCCFVQIMIQLCWSDDVYSVLLWCFVQIVIQLCWSDDRYSVLLCCLVQIMIQLCWLDEVNGICGHIVSYIVMLHLLALIFEPDIPGY